MSIKIGQGIHSIWVVTSGFSDGSEEPQLLAAYDGADGYVSAQALIAVIKQAGSSELLELHRVPVWPNITDSAKAE